GFSLPGADWILPADELKRLYRRDVEGAKRLLQEAGARDTSFEMSISREGEAVVSAAELITAQLKEVGVTVQIRVIDATQFTQAVCTRGEFVAYNSAGNPTPITNADLFGRFRTGGPRNIFRFSDPQLDAMIDRQATMVRDPEGRKKLLLDIQRRLIDSA